jgi:hypothetical protein
LRGISAQRRLYARFAHHDEIAYISDEEHELLDRAAKLIGELVDAGITIRFRICFVSLSRIGVHDVVAANSTARNGSRMSSGFSRSRRVSRVRVRT